MTEIYIDDEGNKIAIIPEILFSGKQNIDWQSVEKYLKKYLKKNIEITLYKDIINIGKIFPDEYAGSEYTGSLRGALAKAKANAVQGIETIVKIASEKQERENYKRKHKLDAAQGWYYYTTRFALPIYNNEIKTDNYNIYVARLVVNRKSNKKLYLYDLVDIKKEASTLLRTKS